MIKVHNVLPKLFHELQGFLEYYSDTEYPISICVPVKDHEQIFYNTEQLTRTSELRKIKDKIKNFKIIEIWDYSIENINILHKNGITNTRYFPPKIWPEYRDKLLSYNDGSYNYDVAFCGLMSSDRINVINKLRNKKISCNIINGYGDYRDKLIAKCKILLNIHYAGDYKIFEKIRCFPWLDTGKTIISHNSLDADPRCINVSIHNIVETVISTLNSFTA